MAVVFPGIDKGVSQRGHRSPVFKAGQQHREQQKFGNRTVPLGRGDNNNKPEGGKDV
jgi:hypothetical protein